MIGIMQGRLSPPSPIGPQAFPSATWKDEFATAAALGFDAIEWLVEAASLADNPLFSADGRAEMAELSRRTGVAVVSACCHCILEWRPFDPGGRERLAGLPHLVGAAGAAGLARLVLPVLEEASLALAPSLAEAATLFATAVTVAERHGLDLVFELDRPAAESAAFIDALGSPRARLCYDSGNATAMGFDIAAEIAALAPLVAEIHIKDRIRGGKSRPLGEGDTPFATFRTALGDALPPMVLETPPGEDAVASATRNLKFVREWLRC